MIRLDYANSFFSLTWILFFTTCLSSPSTQPDPKILELTLKAHGTLYLCGSYQKNKRPWACYWKNARRIDLNVPGEALAIFVNDDGIFLSGYFLDKSTPKACWWENGQIKKTDTTGRYTAIAVIDRQVHTAGNSLQPNGRPGHADYRRDGRYIPLEKAVTPYEIHGLYADSDGTVYIAGNAHWHEPGKICFWRNGRQSLLSDNGRGRAILKDQDRVYIAGTIMAGYDRKAAYWQNGTRKDLHDAAMALCIAIYKKDVYCGGALEKKTALYPWTAVFWHNLKLQDLGVAGQINAILARQDALFLAGIYSPSGSPKDIRAALWINNTLFDLGSETRVYGMVLTERE